MRNNDLNVHLFENKNPSMYVHVFDRQFFFSNFDCKKKNNSKYECTELFPEKTEAVYAEQNKGEKAATSSYSAAVDF